MNNAEIKVGSGDAVCPYLGIMHDPSTSLAYPSDRNVCYQSKSLDTPRLDQQGIRCLVEAHLHCPMFSGEPLANLPNYLRVRTARPQHGKMNYWVIAVLGLSVISVMVVLLQRGILIGGKVPGPGLSSTIAAGYSPINPELMKPSQTMTRTPVTEPATVTPQASVVSLQATETVMRKLHGLDEPIGAAQKFVIHRILQGESLYGLSTRYNTSVEAIKNVNYNMPDPVWVNWLVIIPVDSTDVSGSPRFEAYEELAGGVSLEKLAEVFNVEVSDLVYYNNLEAGTVILKGEWLLIPFIIE